MPKARNRQSVEESQGYPSRPQRASLEPLKGTVEPTRVLKEGIFGNSKAQDTVSIVHEPSVFTEGRRSNFSTPRLQQKEMKAAPVKRKRSNQSSSSARKTRAALPRHRPAVMGAHLITPHDNPDLIAGLGNFMSQESCGRNLGGDTPFIGASFQSYGPARMEASQTHNSSSQADQRIDQELLGN